MKNFAINSLEWYKIINNHWDDPSLVLYVCFRHLALSYALATTGAVGTALTINNMVKVGTCIIKTSDTYSQRALLADFKIRLLFFQTLFIWHPWKNIMCVYISVIHCWRNDFQFQFNIFMLSEIPSADRQICAIHGSSCRQLYQHPLYEEQVTT